MADSTTSTPPAVRPFIRTYGLADVPPFIPVQQSSSAPPASDVIWRVPETGGEPIFAVGLEIASGSKGTVFLDYLTWDGPPEVTLTRPARAGELWRRAWVDAVDQFEDRWPESFRIVKNEGFGLISQGTPTWTDYRVSASVTIRLARTGGIAARVGGLRRHYALLLDEASSARLVKTRHCSTDLAVVPYAVERDRAYELTLEVRGRRISGAVDGVTLFDVADDDHPLTAGGVALVVEDGCLSTDAVRVRAVE